MSATNETTALPPLEIVDGAFTLIVDGEPIEVSLAEDHVRIEDDGMWIDIPEAEMPRFVDALARLTGNGPILLQVADFIQRTRREAIEEVARWLDAMADEADWQAFRCPEADVAVSREREQAFKDAAKRLRALMDKE